ncbi:hypothetical protein HCU64_00005 [Methylobacterium sp. C25]|uniref:hypothetical protein n=1 Tax=Methylobacterium sp. C25 TaxID=2721622 RepID=UPI001F2140D9|nr:hypothetical protein [Methylobacterium sp. C25]MCE4222121.1 hypothetical protein [Methylobacterium sp. C25]
MENRYRFKTKGQMLDEVAHRGFVERAVPTTISCSSISKARWDGHAPGHCGYCVPCLIRRAAETRAYGREPTAYVGLPQLNGRVDPRTSIGEHIRAFDYMAERLRQKPEITGTLVRKPGPLMDYTPDDIQAYTGVFAEGIREVGRALRGVRATAI